MGFILYLTGLIIIGLTFDKIRNKTNVKEFEVFGKHKWKYRIGGFILMVIGSALIVDTSQSTVETPDISEENLKQTVASFYNEKYPEAKIYGQNNEAIIYFPSKKSPPPATDYVGFIKWSSGVYLVVNCDLDNPHNRSLGSKECLSDEDKEGRSIIDALYYIYNLEKPSKEEFIEYIRHNCLESECYINDMPVMASNNKKYMLNIRSFYISPKNKHIQYVYIDISPAQ
jgi:hypothetical protein